MAVKTQYSNKNFSSIKYINSCHKKKTQPEDNLHGYWGISKVSVNYR